MTAPLSARAGARRAAAVLILLAAAVAALGALAPSARAEGMFVAECDYTHRASNDPIVFHGLRGMSHLHEFFGNPSTNASSTVGSLRRATGECEPKADESAYWVPALYRNGKIVKPIAAQVYYQDFGRYGRVLPFPPGLRMIAGNPGAKKPLPTYQVGWECSSQHGGATQTIPTCTDAQGDVTLRISFPDCWDGKRLDSPDHRAHMAYNRDNGFEPYLQKCPNSHPVLVPQLQVNVFYPIDDGKGVRLASGPYVTAHADFFNAWKPSVLRAKVDQVLNASKACHPYFGCMQLPGEREPLVARPHKKLDKRFYRPRGMAKYMAKHGRHSS